MRIKKKYVFFWPRKMTCDLDLEDRRVKMYQQQNSKKTPKVEWAKIMIMSRV